MHFYKYEIYFQGVLASENSGFENKDVAWERVSADLQYIRKKMLLEGVVAKRDEFKIVVEEVSEDRLLS